MNLEKEVERYSKKNGYPISEYYELACECGSDQFELYSDDEEGGAFVRCVPCGSEQDIEKSREYICEQAQNICNCDNTSLKIGIGKSFYLSSTETRWVYVGASCSKCELKGVYVDWAEK